MNIPTQAQVNAFARNLASMAGGAILMLGLSSKIDVNTVNQVIAASGTVVNDIIILIGFAGPLMAALKAGSSASPASQAAAAASVPGATVITTPEIAAAVPADNVVSNTDVRPVNK